MTWVVTFSKRAQKQQQGLPPKARQLLVALVIELERVGPVRGDWPNYSRLGGSKERKHHCHLNKKGRPTYVAVWEETTQGLKVVEIIYVGTRENAPY